MNPNEMLDIAVKTLQRICRQSCCMDCLHCPACLAREALQGIGLDD